MVGYNENFESWVNSGSTYDSYYIKVNEYGNNQYSWGDYIKEDALIIIAVEQGAASSALQAILEDALGTVEDDGTCITTTSTTTTTWPTTSTTSTLIP